MVVVKDALPHVLAHALEVVVTLAALPVLEHVLVVVKDALPHAQADVLTMHAKELARIDNQTLRTVCR